MCACVCAHLLTGLHGCARLWLRFLPSCDYRTSLLLLRFDFKLVSSVHQAWPIHLPVAVWRWRTSTTMAVWTSCTATGWTRTNSWSSRPTVTSRSVDCRTYWWRHQPVMGNPTIGGSRRQCLNDRPRRQWRILVWHYILTLVKVEYALRAMKIPNIKLTFPKFILAKRVSGKVTLNQVIAEAAIMRLYSHLSWRGCLLLLGWPSRVEI